MVEKVGTDQDKKLAILTSRTDSNMELCLTKFKKAKAFTQSNRDEVDQRLGQMESDFNAQTKALSEKFTGLSEALNKLQEAQEK